ncbi:MAG: phosphoribosylanthranilate isomerase [Syntrophales bacterium]|nr:phosphoribosylanthranilate isomerase [Syntrophales bacterium]
MHCVDNRMGVKIKVCGITRKHDALLAASLGIHALGFIFYLESPRNVEPEAASEIIKLVRELYPHCQNFLPGALKMEERPLFRPAFVGVFVNEDPFRVKEIMDYCGLDFIQLHGDESPDYCRFFPKDKVIKVFTLRSKDDLYLIEKYDLEVVMIDNRTEHLYGGTGLTADWDLAKFVGARYRLVLSGGLNSGNVADAIRKVLPFAVDVNSGIESSPGVKDSFLMVDFVLKVREICKEIGYEAISLTG